MKIFLVRIELGSKAVIAFKDSSPRMWCASLVQKIVAAYEQHEKRAAALRRNDRKTIGWQLSLWVESLLSRCNDFVMQSRI